MYKTKNEVLEDWLRSIIEFSTRHKRGTDEQSYLKSDLERIEQLTETAKTILNSNKEEYSYYDIEKIKLKEFKEGIEKITKK